jgi:hypothetical protein
MLLWSSPTRIVAPSWGTEDFPRFRQAKAVLKKLISRFSAGKCTFS